MLGGGCLSEFSLCLYLQSCVMHTSAALEVVSIPLEVKLKSQAGIGMLSVPPARWVQGPPAVSSPHVPRASLGADFIIVGHYRLQQVKFWSSFRCAVPIVL